MIGPGRIWVRLGVPVLLFALAFAVTLLLIQRWKRNEAKVPPNAGSTDNIPGLAAGDSVNLPKLPSLRNDYVELNSVKQKYLLCVFLSAECASCAQDHEFWVDLKKETGENVAVYVIAMDVDQSTVEK